MLARSRVSSRTRKQMSRVKKVGTFGVAAILGAYALACALFVVFLAHYQPAVVAAPGYDMHWPTRPAAWAAITKSYQSFVETRTCEYTVLGWSDAGTLYFEETCQDSGPQVWSYNPDSENEPSAVEASPPDLFQQAVLRRAILDWVHVPQVRPANAEPSVRRLAVRVDGVASPNGCEVAVVVRHIYGPEDVLVLESEEEGVPLVDVPDYGLTQLLQDLHAAGLAVEGTGMAVDYRRLCGCGQLHGHPDGGGPCTGTTQRLFHRDAAPVQEGAADRGRVRPPGRTACPGGHPGAAVCGRVGGCEPAFSHDQGEEQ